MADVIFVAVLVAFFGVAWALVKACDRIIGPDVLLAEERTSDGALAGAPEHAPEALAS